MVTLTPPALAKMHEHMHQRENTLGIRLGVRTSGCNGYAYVLEFVSELDSTDTVIENDGLKFFLDPKSLIALNGTELDYVRQGLNEGFEYNNPNVKASCGCGESFTI
jgi:iron-sulfur cluster assembly protein